MIVVDVETTGTDPQKHSIVSIGAIDLLNPESQFYRECKIWRGAQVTQQALNVNGFTSEQLLDQSKKSEGEITKEFFLWREKCSQKMLAGHNPSFDAGFLRAGAKRTSLSISLPYRTIDLHSLCYAHHLQRGVELPKNSKGEADIISDSVHEYVGIPSEPKPHHALNGARWEAEAFYRLLHGKNLLQEFEQYPVPEYLKSKQDL